MHATVIDTLRYADRLKEAGLEPGQAEAMSRALNDELTEGLVTRTDLDDAVLHLKGDIGELGTRIDALAGTVLAMDERSNAMEAKFEVRFDAMDADLEAKFGTVDSRFDAMDVRFETIEGRLDAMDVRFDAMDVRFDALDGRFEIADARFEAVDARFEAVDARFEAVDGRFDAVDTQFHALRSQSRYLFLVLALIAGLGLYNATAPHFVKGVPPQQDRTALR